MLEKAPGSVVLIGSSSLKEEVGMTSPVLFHGIEKNLREYFEGRITVIDVDEPAPIDGEMAVIALPPERSLKWAERCGEAGVKVIIQITGGFSSEQRWWYLNLVRRFGFRLLGPNTIMGVIDTYHGLNTTFNISQMPERGPVSFITQSGGVGAAILDQIIDHGLGMSRFFFVGDKLDIGDEDLLQTLANDENTKAIGMYMEGVVNGRRFVDVASSVTACKPVVALKGGISEEGQRRALSHTASVSGSDDIYDIALREAGVIRVGDLSSLLVTTEALAHQPPAEGPSIAIVSNVGGPSILTADAIFTSGLKMARLSDSTVEAVVSKYPGVEMINPVDLIADADADRYRHVLEAVLKDDGVDGVIIMNQMKSCFFKPEDVQGILDAVSGSEKPVIDVVPGEGDFNQLKDKFINAGIPAYSDPVKAVTAMLGLYKYGLVRRGEYV